MASSNVRVALDSSNQADLPTRLPVEFSEVYRICLCRIPTFIFELQDLGWEIIENLVSKVYI